MKEKRSESCSDVIIVLGVVSETWRVPDKWKSSRYVPMICI